MNSSNGDSVVINNENYEKDECYDGKTSTTDNIVVLAGTVGAVVELSTHGGYHAHWDCFSGAAGDMMLAACLDAAETAFVDKNTASSSASLRLLHTIEQAIQLGLPDLAGEFKNITGQRVWRGHGSITAWHVTVNSWYPPPPAPVPGRSPQHSTHSHEHHEHHHHHHEHEHHHHEHEHQNHESTTTTVPHNVAHYDDAYNSNHPEHHHDHDHHHPRESAPTDNDTSHTHTTPTSSESTAAPSHDRIRNLPEIRRMLSNASELYIPKWVRDHAIRAFTELAHAEAAVHGAASIDNVHFHEVGAIDSIVDTVGTLLALYHLNVTSVSCSRLPMGEGMVSTAHGILPVPAPATLQLLTGMPLTAGPPGRTGELVTPTAASLLRVLVTAVPHQQYDTNTIRDGRAPDMTLCHVGIGAGTKDFQNHPNIIRLLIGELPQPQKGNGH